MTSDQDSFEDYSGFSNIPLGRLLFGVVGVCRDSLDVGIVIINIVCGFLNDFFKRILQDL